MSYIKTEWAYGDSITPADMNRIEEGVKSMSDKASSSYTKTIWKAGDTVSAEKLNNIENGIEHISELIDGAYTTQTKEVSYTPIESQITDTITKDDGYDFLDEVNVTVNAVSSNYVGSNIPRRNSNNVTVVQNPLSVAFPSGYYETSVSKSLDLEPSLVRFIDYDGEILYEYSKDEFLSLSSMPPNPDTSRFKRLAGAIITDPSQKFFNGVTNNEGKISFNVVEIENWSDYPYLTVDGIGFNNTTLNDFFDAMLDKVSLGHHDSVIITKNNKQYKLIVDWPADDGVNILGTLQILELQENLIPQGWNWSLSDAKAYVQEWGYLNIGQMYITVSGDTEIDIELPKGSIKLSPYISLSVNGTINIDWGDNSTSSTVTGTSLTTRKTDITHTYSQPGNYTITIHVNSGSFAFYCTDTYTLLNDNKSSSMYNTVYSSSVKNIRIGEYCSIGNYAFDYCYSLQSVTISNSVTSIGSSAFRNCYSLQSITIPNTVTSIGQYTFADCYSLQSITIPNSIISIDGNAFSNCYSLQSITIPNSVTSFYQNAFSGCRTLNVKIIPKNNFKNIINTININNIDNVFNYMYENCYPIQSVTISNVVTSIGTYAFNNCYSLQSVTIPNSVTSIGANAFYYCYSLQSISIPGGITSISGSAFQNCYSLQSVLISENVTSIGTYAFYDCYSLNSIALPNTLTTIGSSAFSGCKSVQSIDIPNTVTSISSSAFEDCYSLSSINIPNTITSISNRVFYDCHSLSSITIPDTITSIGDSAFRNCYALKEIIIPNSVTSIGNYAFNSCYDMREYHFKSTTPPTLGSTAFSGIPSNCIIYVPQGSLSAYQTANNWSTYASYMQEENN